MLSPGYIRLLLLILVVSLVSYGCKGERNNDKNKQIDTANLKATVPGTSQEIPLMTLRQAVGKLKNGIKRLVLLLKS